MIIIVIKLALTCGSARMTKWKYSRLVYGTTAVNNCSILITEMLNLIFKNCIPPSGNRIHSRRAYGGTLVPLRDYGFQFYNISIHKNSCLFPSSESRSLNNSSNWPRRTQLHSIRPFTPTAELALDLDNL